MMNEAACKANRVLECPRIRSPIDHPYIRDREMWTKEAEHVYSRVGGEGAGLFLRGHIGIMEANHGNYH